MMEEDFEFHDYIDASVKNSDFENANKRLMSELALILVRDKSDFVDMLNEAGITADVNMSDAELINLFVNNIPTNRKLILGASLLTNIHNKKMGFDGDKEVSDIGVKSCYCVMTSCFTDEYSNLEGEEEFSNLIPVGFLANAVKNFVQGRKQKQAGSTNTQQAQQDAKRQMMLRAKAMREAEAKRKRKVRNTWLIVGGSIVGLSLIGLLIYKMRKK